MLANDEIHLWRERGFDITNFLYKIDHTNPDELVEAVSTIKDHHPDEVVFVEAA
jgi:hypothetical protein